MDEAVELAKRRLGSIVGNWTLERVLGAGGVGAVYKATNPNGEAAAIKVLHAELAHKSDVRERFLREGTLANKVGHDGALRILDQGTTPDGAGFLVMELLEGETISELLRKDGPIGVKELFGYLDQVLDVLVRAHDAGIIHRDLKPDNLFLTVSGQLKVLDFGLARRLADITGCFKTKTGLALGTLPYMAPEQALGRRTEVDGRVDLFALGAMAFRVLAQRKVHEADSEAELLMKMASTPAPPLARFAPNLPPGVHQVVDMALCFSRDARYPDARTMQQDLRDVLAGRPPRYATHQHEQRANQTRLAVTVPPQPSSRRVARTEPLDTRPAREPPAGTGGPVGAPTARLGPLPPAPPSEAHAFAAGVTTTAPFSHPPGFIPASGPRAPAFPPAAPVVAAPPRSKAPLVLLSALALLCLLAAGGLAFVLHDDEPPGLGSPTERAPTLAPPTLRANQQAQSPRPPAVAAAPVEPSRAELPGAVPAVAHTNAADEAARKSAPALDAPTTSEAARVDPDASAPAEPAAPDQGKSEAPALARGNRASDTRSKPAATPRPAAPRLGRPRD